MRKHWNTHFHQYEIGELRADTETGMLQGEPSSAMCVQSFDDSLNSAIHITYRISLRSSSLREPRYPLLRVVFDYILQGFHLTSFSQIC
jgi:hypothetical protein